jgi:hypothetical protein
MTPTESTDQKPLAVRCPGCQELIFNEVLNLKTHKLVCPQVLKMRLQKLEERLDGIEGTVDELEQAPAPEPAVALTVGDWPDDDEDDDLVDPELADEDENTAPVAATAHAGVNSYFQATPTQPDDEDNDF